MPARERALASRAALAVPRERLDAFLGGSRPLTGLELYLLLERHTRLLEFHAMLRPGPANRLRSGLQQSYGDHNRLLLVGLDKLEAGDLAWYRGRLERPGEVADAELVECFAAVRSLGLTPSLKVALWLGGALHDCGKLAGDPHGVDAESGVAVGATIVSALCPDGLGDLALFVVRNHDAVKDLFFGEVPLAFLGDQLDRLAPGLRPLALAALGMVQVTGAASLGEGRLSSFRVEIFRRCFDGRTLGDRSAGARLARLMEAPQLDVSPEIAGRWSGDASPLRSFLDRIPLHGWHRRWLGAGAAPESKLIALRSIAERFGADFGGHHHVVIGSGVDLGSATTPGWRLPPCRSTSFRNGTRAMVIGARPIRARALAGPPRWSGGRDAGRRPERCAASFLALT